MTGDGETYSYPDNPEYEEWGDQLQSINGYDITYDNIGNLLEYYLDYIDEFRLFDLEWEGRNLVYLSENSAGELDIYYAYNDEGIRISKTVADTEYKYTLNGTQIVSQEWDDKLMLFFYDESGFPIGYAYRTTSMAADTFYYYVFERNVQGDVVAIYNTSGTKLVSYTYDAWGNVSVSNHNISGTNAGAQYNPFRYRGYYYDEEVGLYYLNSRYYDPSTGRFLNADDISYLGADGSPLSYNLFAYCMNNPVNYFDDNGNWSMPNWAKVAIGAVATVAAVVVTVATGGAALPVLIGVVASTIGGAALSAVNHRLTTGSWEGAGNAALNGAADGFMTGGLCALGGSLIGGAIRTIKNARSGITIGKVGTFEDVAKLAKTRHYSGLKEFNLIKKVAGKKAAETVGWWQNKCVLKGVMALKGSIYDCGGALTGAYAKEVALTKGYQYLFNVWLM